MHDTSKPRDWQIGFPDGTGAEDGAIYIVTSDKKVVVRGGRHNCKWSVGHGVQTLADAHLISAAPDLLAVCEMLEWRTSLNGNATCPCCGEYKDDGHHSTCELSAAIARAKGEANA